MNAAIIHFLLITFTIISSVLGVRDSSCTIGKIIADGTPCETSAVFGLTKQIAEELNQMGISFVSINSESGVNCTQGCSGFIQQAPLDSLSNISRKVGRVIKLSSAWRSTAQQYLLYQWKNQSKCGQTNIVFTPGTSNHEGGIAIDVPDYKLWEKVLTENGWSYPMPDIDKVHFEYGAGTQEFARKNLLAFQRLWNRNNPNQIISEDGVFGPETAAAFEKSPCDGWVENLE
jgi:hypothetical protein